MEKLLLDLDNIVSGSRDLASLQRGVVTIAALPSICAGALPPVLRAFREAYPGVEVRLRDVVARARLSHGLDFDVVMVDRLCLFVPEQHPLARQQRVRLTDLSGQPSSPGATAVCANGSNNCSTSNA